MNRGYVFTPLAEADLDDIWDYVAERFGFDLADGVLESLHRAFQLLAENPGIGHTREDIAPPPIRSGPSSHRSSRFVQTFVQCKSFALFVVNAIGPGFFPKPESPTRSTGQPHSGRAGPCGRTISGRC